MNSAFHCLLPVRDESDIIRQSLDHLLTWADWIYVFDTGSVDSTWEILLEYAAHEKRIVPLQKDSVYFSENRLRGWLFHQARQRMRNGDWFLRVDADEFHHIAPPEFVRTRLRQNETIVYHQYYNFVLRECEVKNWESGRESISDRSRPIELRRQWYAPSVYSEPRLCKYRSTMRWPPTVSFPYNAGFVARERIPIRHYPHRDPLQLERRCRLRAIMMSDLENRRHWTKPELHHWSEREWRNFVSPDDSPELAQWYPGIDLKEVHLSNHLAKPHIRLSQYLAHRYLLPVLDRTRPKWPEEEYPQRIPQSVVEELLNYLSVAPSDYP